MRRRTRIVATIGPASRNRGTIASLIAAGADVFRLNFSYGSQEEHTQAVGMIREAARQAGRPIAILQDLQGPKMRVGGLKGGPYELRAGDPITITGGVESGDARLIPMNHPELLRQLKAGDRILLGDGEVELRVLSTNGVEVNVEVVAGGTLKENQGFHLPGVRLSLDPVTEKDIADLRFGLQLGVDYVALSFVRSGKDLRQLKRLMREQGGSCPLIAKLEREEAIENLEGILAEAEGVMVARGDLALEVSPEQVPTLQKRIIRQANQRGALVITATQMLESMVHSPRPTRAEASDVANAILDGSDALMLSAETAVGRYPQQVVEMMARIAVATEKDYPFAPVERPRLTHAEAMSRAACFLAKDVAAAAIVVFTRSGYSARLISKERPRVPIFAFSPSEEIWRQLSLVWGVTPLRLDFPPAAEEMIARAEAYLLEQGLLKGGDTAVVARWAPLEAPGWSNFVKVHRLGSSG